jgi:transcriptional regulator with XRE-family HTH domain
MDKKLREIGARIDAIIKEKGFSRAELGAILGVKEGAIGRHIRGETDPGTIALTKIAEIADCSLDWLITGKDKETKPRYKDYNQNREEQLRLILTSDPALWGKIRDDLLATHAREEEAQFKTGAGTHLSEEEKEMLEYYRQADQKIKRAACRMLKDDVEESRRNDGGGSNSAEGNCA